MASFFLGDRITGLCPRRSQSGRPHGTAEKVADQIRALADAGMTYLMAAPLSRRSFTLLSDKVIPRVAV